MTIPLPSIERRWSIAITRQAAPIGARMPARPTLERRDAGSGAFFVADPFLARHEDEWFVFFESLERDGRGRIGCARSRDAAEWEYGGIVLDEPFHVSYPCVFTAGGTHYMTPESLAAGRIGVYRAVVFPHRWELAATAVDHAALVDPTVFPHEGRWWLLAATSDGRRLFAYYAAAPEGPWTGHPHNPIVTDRTRARPGGRPFVVDGRLWRPAQDVSRGYGRRVAAIEILELSPRAYREAVDARPLGGPSGRGWNAHGMHHVDALPDPRGGWMVAADGFRHDLMFGYRRAGTRA